MLGVCCCGSFCDYGFVCSSSSFDDGAGDVNVEGMLGRFEWWW